MQALWSHIPRKSLKAEQMPQVDRDLANVSFAWVLHSTDGAPVSSEADAAIVVADLRKFTITLPATVTSTCRPAGTLEC